MSRLVHFQGKKNWKPSDLNWWLTQRYRHCPLIADNLYLSSLGTSVNWVSIAVLGCVRTQYFKLQKMDAFSIGESETDYEKQADLAPAHWDHRISIEEVLKTEAELYAYDQVYAAATKFLDGMAERREGEAPPLPAPPVPKPIPAPVPAPVPPKPVPAPQPEPAKPVPNKDWWKVAIPAISAIILVLADLLGPWGGILKLVWGVIKAIIGG